MVVQRRGGSNEGDEGREKSRSEGENIGGAISGASGVYKMTILHIRVHIFRCRIVVSARLGRTSRHETARNRLRRAVLRVSHANRRSSRRSGFEVAVVVAVRVNVVELVEKRLAGRRLEFSSFEAEAQSAWGLRTTTEGEPSIPSREILTSLPELNWFLMWRVREKGRRALWVESEKGRSVGLPKEGREDSVHLDPLDAERPAPLGRDVPRTLVAAVDAVRRMKNWSAVVSALGTKSLTHRPTFPTSHSSPPESEADPSSKRHHHPSLPTWNSLQRLAAASPLGGRRLLLRPPSSSTTWDPNSLRDRLHLEGEGWRG